MPEIFSTKKEEKNESNHTPLVSIPLPISLQFGRMQLLDLNLPAAVYGNITAL